METSSKQFVKNKRKKRKSQQSDGNTNSSVRPELFDGMSNWLKLQKVGTLLKHTSELLLKTLGTIFFILSFLCYIIPKGIGQVKACLSYISKKVLAATAEERVPEKSSKSEEAKKFSKPNKAKPQSGKKSFRKGEIKPQFKFDFAERQAALLASQTRSNGAGFGRGKQKKISNLSDSDHSPETMDSKKLTKTLAMDCEMVGTGSDGIDSIIARVSIVNTHGECVYDEFVKPMEKVTDYRTTISGVRPADLKHGKDLFEVQKDILSIIEERRIVGHDLKHDFDVLFISHPRSLIRDTSKYKPFREISGGRTPSLKKLVAVILGCSIQGGEHSSIEDAQAAMLLYLKHKRDWEKSIKSFRRRRPAQ